MIKEFLLKCRGYVRRSKKPWSRIARISDYLLTLLISLGGQTQISKAYNEYLKGKASPGNIDELVISSNFLSRGKQRNRLVEDAKFKFNLNSFSQLSTILSKFDVEKCVEELHKDGFTRIPVRLDENFIDELHELATHSEVKPTKFAKIQHMQPHPIPAIDHIWDVPFEATIRSQACQKLIQDKQLLTIAGMYLNANPVVIGSRLYWSLSHDNEEFLTAENWHVDAGDGLRFVKLFVTLTDVYEKNGPTGFIKGTHTTLPRKFYSGRRFHEKEISSRFQGKIIEATGVKGTIYLVDTRGLHRGTPVKEGRRLLLHFFYGTDFFGFPRPTTFGLSKEVCFGDRYSGTLRRTFAAFTANSAPNTAEISGP